jgi:hypothetical protein
MARVAAALGAALVAASCRQIAGIDDRKVWTSGDEGSACDGFVPASATCDACAGERCCAEIEACRADPLCASVFECSGQCAHGDVACQSTACDYVCGGVGPALSGLVEATEACGACTTTACCAKASACAESADCLGFGGCLKACNVFDQACRDACASTYDAGFDAAAGLRVCVWSNCRAPCDIGSDWGRQRALRGARRGANRRRWPRVARDR